MRGEFGKAGGKRGMCPIPFGMEEPRNTDLTSSVLLLISSLIYCPNCKKLGDLYKSQSSSLCDVIRSPCRVIAQAVSSRLLTAEAWVRGDLWCTKWHWDRLFSEFFGFRLSVSFDRRSIFIHVSSGG
jgi:hypothetical protein